MDNINTIYADFNNADSHGRLRLNCKGSIRDVESQKIALYEGLPMRFNDGELSVEGFVDFSDDENIWVGVIDWDKIGGC